MPDPANRRYIHMALAHRDPFTACMTMRQCSRKDQDEVLKALGRDDVHKWYVDSLSDLVADDLLLAALGLNRLVPNLTSRWRTMAAGEDYQVTLYALAERIASHGRPPAAWGDDKEFHWADVWPNYRHRMPMAAELMKVAWRPLYPYEPPHHLKPRFPQAIYRDALAITADTFRKRVRP